MEDAIANRGLRRTASVQEDWVAWLPEEKDRLFDAILSELEISYGILSVTLDDAFNLCRSGQAFAGTGTGSHVCRTISTAWRGG